MRGSRVHRGAFTWMYYPAKEQTDRAVIAALGDSDHDLLARSTAKFLNGHGCNVLALAPTGEDLKYTGWHNFPLEIYEEAANWLLEHGNTKIGATGGSTTGMMSLLAAAYIPQITLVLAYTPSDFLMQGFYRGKKDGYIPEWPAEHQSCVTWRGEPVPYSPFCLGDEDYYNVTFGASTKEHGEICSLPLFEHVEAQPEFGRGMIPVENAKAKIYVFGAEDDTLWDTCSYIRRMESRVKEKNGGSCFEARVYELGTHFVFPQGLLKAMLPVGGDWAVRLLVGRMFVSGKQHPRECEATRRDVERVSLEAIRNW